MRILLVHHAYPPESLGGSELYVAALARQLAREHDVAVLHRSADPAREDHDVVESRQQGVRVISLNNLHRAVPGFESYRDARVMAAATRILDDFKPDLLHVHHLSGLSTGIVFAARERGVATAITLHDFWPLCPLGQLLNVKLEVCPGPTPRRCLGCVGGQVAVRPTLAAAAGRSLPLAPPIGRLLARLGSGEERIAERLDEMREVLRSADLLLSPSQFLRMRVEAAWGISGIRVLEYGREPLAKAPPREASGQLRIGFLGSAIPSKGVHVLAEAFRSLDPARASLAIHGGFPPYHGDRGYEARVRAILGPAAVAALRGPFAPDAIDRVLAGLDVLVVPSIWEENLPLVVQEAFLVGLPVVVSEHGGLAELVREGIDGLRFRPGDAADLGRVLRRLIEEPGLRASLGKTARAVPTMAEHVAALRALYEEARRRFASRPGRVGVVVLDRGMPAEAAAAAESCHDAFVEARVLIVENGPGPAQRLPVAGASLLQLDSNRGFAGGMNAGIERLRKDGCDRILLLNNDARLTPGALRRLAEAMEDPGLAAVGPVIVRAQDGRVESRGSRFDARSGRFQLRGHGETPRPCEGLLPVESLSGAALMLSVPALDQIGVLEESYFHSFEDVDWCARARAAGLGLAVVLGARAKHGGSRTLGTASAERLYYAARNHLLAAERSLPLRGASRALRAGRILGLNLLHALRQADVPRQAGLRAVLAGAADYRRGRFGPRGASR